MKHIRLALLLLMSWFLTGCLTDREESSHQLGSDSSTQAPTYGQGSAQVNFTVNLPESVSAAFIDTESTRAIEIKIYESQVAGYDVDRGQVTDVLRGYFQCLMLNLATDTSDQEAIDACGYFPGAIVPGGMSQLAVASEVITPDQPSVGFNLEPNQSYVIFAGQYNSEVITGLHPFAWTTTFVTLDEGDNDIELNLISGSWEFDTGVDLQLLNRSTGYAFGDFLDFDQEPVEDFTWWPADNEEDEGSATPAIALGWAQEADTAVQFSKVHLKSFPEFIRGDNNEPPKIGAILQTELGEGGSMGYRDELFGFYPFGMLAPHQPVLEIISAGEPLLFDPDYQFEMDSQGRDLAKGLYQPATLMQQFDPSQSLADRNSHRLGLGTWEVVREERISFEQWTVQFAGLMLASADNDLLTILQGAEPNDDQMIFDQLNVTQPAMGTMVAPPALPGLNIAYFSVATDQGQLLPSDESNSSFQPVLDATSFQLTAPDRMQGSLIEYVGYLNAYERPPHEYPVLSEDEGNFTQEETIEVTPLYGAAVSAAMNTSVNSAGSNKQKTSTQSLVYRNLMLRQLAEQSGLAPVSAASSTGCFSLELNSKFLTSYYQFEDGFWVPGVPEFGYWYQAEDGSYLLDEEGEIKTVGTGASPFPTIEEEGVTYFIQPSEEQPGIIQLLKEEEDLEQNWFAFSEDGEGKAEVCIQPVTLTAGPYSDPRDVDGGLEIQ